MLLKFGQFESFSLSIWKNYGKVLLKFGQFESFSLSIWKKYGKVLLKFGQFGKLRKLVTGIWETRFEAENPPKCEALAKLMKIK